MEKETSLPLYLQVKNTIVEQINSGKIKPGDKLPTEIELEKEFSVSRPTIRHALSEMENEGYLSRHRGIGTIVRHKSFQKDILQLSSFSETIQQMGKVPSHNILSVNIVDPPNRIANYFAGIEPKKVWCVKRLCFADSEPFSINHLYLPPELGFSLQDFYQMKSFYDFIRERFDLIPSYANETITASAANDEMSELLQIEEGEPLLDIWRTTYAEDGQLIEVVHIFYIASRFEYQLQLTK